jgi:stage IV sporulation protein FB
MDEFFDNETEQLSSSVQYPPKPEMAEKKGNSLMRSVLSIAIYASLFYLLFNDIAYIAAILLVIIIHELGHFLMMRYFNYSNVKIFIVPLLGAFTSGKKQDVSQFQWSLIILAGPVPGIIIGTVLYYLNSSVHHETLHMLATSFLYINLLNCLPFYPLDGGRLIETLFFRQNHIIRLVFGIMSIMGLSLLFFYSPIMLIVPALAAMELFNENKHQKIRDYLEQEKIVYKKEYKDLSDKDYWLIRDCLIFSFPRKYNGVSAGVYQYTLAEPLFMQHISSILKANIIDDLGILKRWLLLFFYLFAFIAPLVYLLRTFH